MGWEELLNHFKVDRYQKTDRKELHNRVFDTPAMISDLVEAAKKQFPEHQVTVAIDELDACYAPLDTHDKNDWSAIYLPENVSLVLVFNPGSIRDPNPRCVRDPLHFSTDTPFYHVSCDMRFRSTLSITDLVDCVAERSGMGYEHGSGGPKTPDTLATDVRGAKPNMIDLGNDIARLGDALINISTCLESEERHDITLLYGRYLSKCTQERLTEMARGFNWKAFQACDFTGSEADTVVYVGPGSLEAVGRARLRLSIVLVWDTKKGRQKYDRFQPGFQKAAKRNLVTKLDNKG